MKALDITFHSSLGYVSTAATENGTTILDSFGDVTIEQVRNAAYSAIADGVDVTVTVHP